MHMNCSAALVCLGEMEILAQEGKNAAFTLDLHNVGVHTLCPYSVTLCFCLWVCSYFMKAILEKKYALAHLAIDAVAAHFLRFRKETKVMPVIWHQTLLAFVQR